MGKQPITICFAARKGGVGKSFLAVNVGAFLRAEGKRVLIIGCDDQDDIARRYLIETDFDPEDCTTLSDVLLDDLDPHDAIYQTREYPLYRWHSTFGIVTRIRQGRETATLDFMPAGRRMDEITYDSSDGFAPDMLSGIVERVSDEYDYVLFDTPPSDADISMYAYAASSYVLVPFTSVDDFDSIGRVASTIDVLNAPKKNGRQCKGRRGAACLLHKNAHRSRPVSVHKGTDRNRRELTKGEQSWQEKHLKDFRVPGRVP